MKATILALAAASLLAAPARGQAPDLFAPEPPEPAAATLVETYLPLLAAGQFEQALAFNDLRGMRQYLLDRRLADLKARNPELTARDLEEMSAHIQLADLNPARLQEILLNVMKESTFEGMTWRIRGYAPVPEAVDAYLVSIDAQTPEGRDKPVVIGIKRLGEQWLVAPDVVEEVGRKVLVPGRTLPPPPEVAAAVEAFWTRWQAGGLNEAYALFSEEYRDRVPLSEFLGQAGDFNAQIGAPAAWTIAHCRQLAPGTLGLGVNVQGSAASRPTIMIFRKIGETWVLQDGQFRPPLPPPAAGPGPFRTDLRPDLASPPMPAITPEPPPAVAAPPGPAQPIAPVGPVVP